MPEQESKPESGAPGQAPSDPAGDKDKARRMEEAQEQAAKERRDEGGYQ